MIDPTTYGTDFSASTAALPVRTGAAKIAGEDKEAADFTKFLNGNSSAPTATAQTAPADSGGSVMGFIKGLIDVINPLQHIPVVSTLYRQLTGDEINPVARLAGDTLYGGAIGAAVAMADIATEKTTGHDIGQTVMAALTPASPQKADATMVASGTVHASDIVWVAPDQTDVALNTSLTPRSFPTPLPPTGMNGKDPAPSAPTPTAPALTKDVDSTTFLQSQEAPVELSRTDVPPGLIASKMLDALDKYGAMKQGGLNPQVSALY